MRNRNISNGNTNKPPRNKKGHSPVKANADETINLRNAGPVSSVFHAENQDVNKFNDQAEKAKFGDWHPRDNSAIIQQRDVDGDSTGGRKGKK